MRLAASNVKKISLELGGKSPNIVFADADLERFARGVAVLGLRQLRPGLLRASRGSSSSGRSTSGSSSCSPRRRGRSKVGDPADEATEVGHAGQLQAARARARLHRDRARGGRRARRRRRGTRTIRRWPTARISCRRSSTASSNDMRIAQRGDLRAGRVDHPVRRPRRRRSALANDTPTGSRGSVWSRDIGKALRVAKGIQAGVLSVNSNSSVHTEAPFGGYKMSGIGRELGHARPRPLHRDQERLHRPPLR